MTCSEIEYIPEGSDEFDARSFWQDRHTHFCNDRRVAMEQRQWEDDMDREGEDYERIG